MASFPIDTLKAIIMQRAAKLEMCDALHEVAIATDNLQILQAGCGIYPWIYQTDVVDDTLMDEFTDAEFNAYGIYKNNVTLTNPVQRDYAGCKGYFIENEQAPVEGQELHFVRSTVFTLNLSGSNKVIVWAMGNSTGTINMTGTSKVDIKLLNNAEVTVNLQDNCVLCASTDHFTQLTINSTGQAATIARGMFKSTINYTAGNLGTGKFVMYAKSSINHNVLFPGFIEILKYQKAVENSFIP